MTGAPLITSESANQMREKGLESRFAKKNKEIDELKRRLTEALGPKTEDDLRRKERLLLQVKQCDDMLEDCDDPKTFSQLVSAKARLWELFNPKPGVLKQTRQRQSSNVQPLPQPEVSRNTDATPTTGPRSEDCNG